MGSDSLSEETSTPSDAAFISPEMNVRGFQPHHAFASLDPHGEFGICVDPTVISTAQSPQCDVPADAGLPRVDGSSTLYHEDMDAMIASSPRLPGTASDPCMDNSIPGSHSSLALDPGQQASHDLYTESQVAAQQPLGTGLLPAAFLPSPSRGPVVIPPAPSRGSTRSNSGIGRGSKADGEKGGEVYPCLFKNAGCAGEFPGKNEWKRHINTIHVRWDVWVCAEGDCASVAISWAQSMILREPSFPCRGKIFNRKDLYLMHLGRRHHHLLPPRPSADKKLSCLEQEQVAAQACHRRIKLPRDMEDIACSFEGCEEACGGSMAWDGFLEHVANHLKRALECPLSAVDMRNRITASLTSFGVSAGFLCEGGRGLWKLCDPIWNEAPKRRREHHKRSSCQKADWRIQRTAEFAIPEPPRKRLQRAGRPAPS